MWLWFVMIEVAWLQKLDDIILSGKIQTYLSVKKSPIHWGSQPFQGILGSNITTLLVLIVFRNYLLFKHSVQTTGEEDGLSGLVQLATVSTSATISLPARVHLALPTEPAAAQAAQKLSS